MEKEESGKMVLGFKEEKGSGESERDSGKKKKRKVGKKFVFVCVSRFFLVCLLIGVLMFFPLAKVLYDKHGSEFSEKFFGKSENDA